MNDNEKLYIYLILVATGRFIKVEQHNKEVRIGRFVHYVEPWVGLQCVLCCRLSVTHIHVSLKGPPFHNSLK